MRIGEAARRAGVSVHTLRFYERQGLLPRTGRSAANYRDYSSAALERVALIRQAQRLGFTLTELRGLLEGRDTAPRCAELREIGERKLARIDEELRRLKSMRASIQTLLRNCGGSTATPCLVEIELHRVRRD
jgi:DNA-binding transcriptional MerR regulator